MNKIAIIESIHEEGINLLKKHPNFKYEIITDVSEENLIKTLPDFDGCTLRISRLSSTVLSKCKKLKVISRHGVGYDNVDLDYIKQNNIKLMITATANATAVSEHVMYMMLNLSKSKLLYDNEVRLGNFKKNIKDIQTFELMNKEILIAGFGRIGKSLIKKCIGFDMKVKVFDPYVSNNEVKSYGGVKIDNFNNGLKTLDFLSLHVPLNSKTKNLINTNNLCTMKKNAIIINTSRGGVVNEKDLNSALDNNQIYAAGLDVFEKEPPDLNHPLIKNKKVLLTPHVSALTNECKIRMAKETVNNIIDFFENNPNPSMIVNL